MPARQNESTDPAPNTETFGWMPRERSPRGYLRSPLFAEHAGGLKKRAFGGLASRPSIAGVSEISMVEIEPKEHWNFSRKQLPSDVYFSHAQMTFPENWAGIFQPILGFGTPVPHHRMRKREADKVLGLCAAPSADTGEDKMGYPPCLKEVRNRQPLKQEGSRDCSAILGKNPMAPSSD